MMTEDQKEIERLRDIVSRMTMLAQAGVCQHTAAGKHEFLKDIVRAGSRYGYGILGLPKEGSDLPMPQWFEQGEPTDV
jgi:hypothetical protein